MLSTDRSISYCETNHIDNFKMKTFRNTSKIKELDAKLLNKVNLAMLKNFQPIRLLDPGC